LEFERAVEVEGHGNQTVKNIKGPTIQMEVKVEGHLIRREEREHTYTLSLTKFHFKDRHRIRLKGVVYYKTIK